MIIAVMDMAGKATTIRIAIAAIKGNLTVVCIILAVVMARTI